MMKPKKKMYNQMKKSAEKTMGVSADTKSATGRQDATATEDADAASTTMLAVVERKSLVMKLMTRPNK